MTVAWWRGRWSLVGMLAVALAASAGASPAPGADDAQALAAAIQRHYEQIRDFRADFTHTYEGGVLRKKTVESGQMAIRKPGRMRWTYTSPERKVFVSDGVKLYSYVPADKQVYVATVPTGDDASTPALFLAGKGHLTRDFTAAPAAAPAGAPPASVAVKLTPVKPEREYRDARAGRRPRDPAVSYARDSRPPGWHVDLRVQQPSREHRGPG